MNLTHEQALAVDRIAHWLDHGTEQSFVLAGYAGTGKTTLVRWLFEHLDGRDVWCVAPTGKAVSVLAKKLPDEAVVTTIHSFLYQPIDISIFEVETAQEDVEKLEQLVKTMPLAMEELLYARHRLAQVKSKYEKGQCHFADRDENRRQPVVIADEASMIDEKMEMDLRQHCGKILFVGDSGQLPPVQGTDFFSRNAPNAQLEQIHRQAADSRVLRLATAIRRGEKFTDWGPDCTRVSRVAPADLVASDVVLTGMNETRRKLNRRCREFLRKTSLYPMGGEPIMCLRNKHRGAKLINGVAGVAASDAHYRVRDGTRELLMNVAYQGAVHYELPIDPYHFELYRNPRASRFDFEESRDDAQFDFGYAITTHKAQGSEWPHVTVWDDRMGRKEPEARKRWMYTAITRAQSKLTWVSPP